LKLLNGFEIMNTYDVVIIGGSYAGLSAALPLVRARKNILVIDAGLRRNRFAEHSHGFLTQDGVQAADIVIKAKQQLQQYHTFHWQEGAVQSVEKRDNDFFICIDKELAVQTQRIIIAVGVSDQIPKIDGIQERWGRTIFHCPYCHGYELNQGNLGMLLTGQHSLHVASMLPDWGNTTLLVNGNQHLLTQLDEKTQNLMRDRNINIDERAIKNIIGDCSVQFESDEILNLDALFVSSRPQITAEWIQKLDIEIEKGDFGEFIKTSNLKETNVKGIFACGDVARLGGSVPLAVADGAIAGAAAHQSLIFQ